jgi:hypothetical protein
MLNGISRPSRFLTETIIYQSLLPGESAPNSVFMGETRFEHTFFFHFWYLLYLVARKKPEAQDMENNITNVSVIGRHFSKK